jgi:hypothetical protein
MVTHDRWKKRDEHLPAHAREMNKITRALAAAATRVRFNHKVVARCDLDYVILN